MRRCSYFAQMIFKKLKVTVFLEYINLYDKFSNLEKVPLRRENKYGSSVKSNEKLH